VTQQKHHSSNADKHIKFDLLFIIEKTMTPPNKIDNADLIAFVVLSDNQTRTGLTKHYVEGVLIENFYGLSICKYPDVEGYYLFYCDTSWDAVTDTYHESLEGAIEQAEFEFTNTRNNWVFTSTNKK
jgi:hypothetical protein